MSKTISNQIHSTTGRINVLLIMLFCFLVLPALRAQDVIYPSGYAQNDVMGTSDSRLVASIEENESSVTFKVIAIGELKADAVSFNVFFNPAVLQLTDNDLGSDLSGFIGAGLDLYNANAVEIAGSLSNWQVAYLQQRIEGNYVAGVSQYDVDLHSWRNGMRVLNVTVSLPPSTTGHLDVPPGEIQHVFSFYFNKLNQGMALNHGDIGMGVNTKLTNGLPYCPKWSFGNTLTYDDDGNRIGTSTEVPELFAFRSPSSVYLDSVKTAICAATLFGHFKRGNLSPDNEMIDNTGNSTTGDARLNWDSITQSGFIYTTSDVEIGIPEFSHDMVIDGTTYLFPSDTEIAAGVFTRGSHTFYVVTTGVTSKTDGSGTVAFDAQLSGLLPDSTYNAWAFIHYVFETSNPYPVISDKLRFTLPPFIIYGTVYPFVYSDDPNFDALFPITVSVYKFTETVDDVLDSIPTPEEVVNVVHYDGSIYVPGTPKYPGTIMPGTIIPGTGIIMPDKTEGFDQPGVKINWESRGIDKNDLYDKTPVSGPGDIPVPDRNNAVGIFSFKDLEFGEKYVMRISRAGFLDRFASFTAAPDSIGHRFLLPGDVNGNFQINSQDVSNLNPKIPSSYGDSSYNATYDLNADKTIDALDAACIMFCLNMGFLGYSDAEKWLIDKEYW